MAARRTDQPARAPRPPASSPEADERRLIALATNLAARQLEDGTASAQVITHYLKAGSGREALERERLERENSLLEAKIESLASAKRVEELYEDALNAMRAYSGTSRQEEDYDDYAD